MNKIRIIDLLNKIANSEEIPKKIKYCGTIYEKLDYNNKYYDIETDNKEKDILSEHLANESFYNDEVEIIEEDKEIEKIDIMPDETTPNSYYILNEHGTKCYLTKHSKVIADKVNLLIDKVNSLENK